MSYNPNIRIYGRWLFLVESESRPGLEHLVDFEPELDDEGNPLKGGQPWQCSCEAHYYQVTQPCKHTKAVLKFLRPILTYFAAYPGATPVSVTQKDAPSHKTKRYVLKPALQMPARHTWEVFTEP